MKKIIYFLIGISIINLVGCGMVENTPTKQVEAFLSRYQTLDKAVLDDLDAVLEKDKSFNSDQKEEYRDIMKEHYKDLTYEVKDEVIDGNNATVPVEIEVTDYSKVLAEAEEYRKNNEDKFTDENGNYDESKFNDYRLKKMKETKDKVKYTLELTLTKNENDKWEMDNLTTADEQKLNGTYIS